MWLLLFCVSLFRVFLFFSFVVDIWTFYRLGISRYQACDEGVLGYTCIVGTYLGILGTYLGSI